MKKIAVIGGGITGLTAAWYLKKNGYSPLLYESGEHPGGSIQSAEIDGYLIELGPNSLQETPETTELIADLGLTNEVVEANPNAKNRYIVRNDRLQPLPMSPVSFLKSPLLSWKAKLRLLREPFVRKRPPEPEESLADFTIRRLGQEPLDWLINPFIAGIHAGDPARLSTRHAMPRLFDFEQSHGSLFRGMKATAAQKKPRQRLISFKTGLGRLTGRLTEILDEHIYRNTTVESLHKTENGWQLIASRFNRRLRDTCDAILIALPPSALAKINIENGSDSSGLSKLHEIPAPTVISASLGFPRSAISHPLDGFGMLLPEKEQRQILGTVFTSTLFPGRAPDGNVLLTTFLGGSRNPELAAASETTIRRILLENLRPLLGISGEPEFEQIRTWPHAIPQYNLGHSRFLDLIDRFETDNPGLIIAGTARDGISIGQCIASGKNRATQLLKTQ